MKRKTRRLEAENGADSSRGGRHTAKPSPKKALAGVEALWHSGMPHAEVEARKRMIASYPDLYAFVQRQHDATCCICKLNSIGGTEVPCIHCEAAALMAKAEAAAELAAIVDPELNDGPLLPGNLPRRGSDAR